MSTISPARVINSSPQGEPLYRQVERYIELVIRQRQLEPGDALPSLTELSRLFKVNGLTVRRAIQELASRDVVVTQQGRGTFVSQGAVKRILWVSSVNLFKSESSPYYTDLLHAANQACKAHGLKVEPVWIPNDSPEQAQRYLNATSLRSYAGYFLCACKPDHLFMMHIRRARLPHVLISQTGERSAWTVCANIAQGNELAIRHLASQGCRRIVVMSYGHGQMTELRSLAQTLGLDMRHVCCSPDQPRMADVERLGMEETLKLLRSDPSIDGWYVTDDILARGATRAMLMQGLAGSPPKVLVRTGIEQSFPYGLPVTYIACSITEQAQQAVNILLDQVESRPGETSFTTSFKLVPAGVDGKPLA